MPDDYNSVSGNDKEGPTKNKLLLQRFINLFCVDLFLAMYDIIRIETEQLIIRCFLHV